MIRNSWGSLVEGVADVLAAEVSAHDVGLTLSAVEEPAGFGGEFGLVPGPMGVRQAAFDNGTVAGGKKPCTSTCMCRPVVQVTTRAHTWRIGLGRSEDFGPHSKEAVV